MKWSCGGDGLLMAVAHGGWVIVGARLEVQKWIEMSFEEERSKIKLMAGCI